ncbi:hypothetical protein PENTCL1PPCAC_26903, partial [Pristionchus entomophagus]
VRRWISTLFSSRFLLYTNTVTSCTMLCAGDALQQAISYNEGTELDGMRTARMTAMGLILGPMTHGWYKFLDGYPFRGSPSIIAIKKIVCDVAVAPAFSSTTITGIVLLEGKSVSVAMGEYRQKFWHLFLLDLSVWPPVQFLNFFFLPPSFRVLYVNCVVLAYNCCLSYIKHNHTLGEPPG